MHPATKLRLSPGRVPAGRWGSKERRPRICGRGGREGHQAGGEARKGNLFIVHFRELFPGAYNQLITLANMIRRRGCAKPGRRPTALLVAAVLILFWYFSTFPQFVDEWQSKKPSPTPASQKQPSTPLSTKPQDPWNASSVLVGDVIIDGSFKSESGTLLVVSCAI